MTAATFFVENRRMFGRMKQDLQRELGSIREAGLYKEERWILSPQGADIRVVYTNNIAKR